MRELFFFVDERLPKELQKKVKEAAQEASIIYDAPTIYAGSIPISGILGSHFTTAGPVIRKTEYGVQRDAGKMLGKTYELLRRGGRRIVFVTVDDLTCLFGQSYLNFCFGLTLGAIGTVISIARFTQLPIEEQKIILVGLIMHELGHIYDVASDGRRAHTKYSLGMHCTDKYCVMQQGLTIDSLRENFLRVNKAKGNSNNVESKYYCKMCRNDIDKWKPIKSSTRARTV